MQLIASLALLALAATGVLAQPQINTPAAVTECEPTQLTFSGGSPPYFISILPGGQISASPIESLGQVSGNSLTWNADIASNTPITFEIKDSTGQTAFSGIVTVQAGSSTTCVGKNSASSGTATGTASGSASVTSAASASGASSVSSPSAASSVASVSAPSSAASSTPTSGATSAAKPASSASSATSAAVSAASTSSSAAMKVNSGWASGVIGMLLAALLA